MAKLQTYPEDSMYPRDEQYQYGLTKREYFAAMAMQGILSNAALLDILATDSKEWVSGNAVRQADDLIKALNEMPVA